MSAKVEAASGPAAAVMCHGCGYDVRAQPAEGRCPECDASVAESLRRQALPVRPAWAESDPRWRRAMVAGTWVIVAMPLVDWLRATGMLYAIPAPNLYGPIVGISTLGDTLFSNFDIVPMFAFWIGTVLLFTTERNRGIDRYDWTGRWGILASCITCLMAVVGIVFIIGLVVVGIGAVLLSIPLTLQPAATRFTVEAGNLMVRYMQPIGGSVRASLIGPVAAAMTILLACAPLKNAIRSTEAVGRRSSMMLLLVAVAVCAVVHLGMFLAIAFTLIPPSWDGGYFMFFRPELLVWGWYGDGRPAYRVVLGLFVVRMPGWAVAFEAVKWLTMLTIAVYLSVVQVRAWVWRRVGRAGRQTP